MNQNESGELTDVRRVLSKDLLSMEWVSDPRISPCGGKALFCVKKVSSKDKDKKYETGIHAAFQDSNFPFTSGPQNDTTPRWSPDGKKVAFLSDRGGDGTQIYVISTEGGEAIQMTAKKAGVGEPVWSPDSRKVAFSAPPEPKKDEPDGEKSDVRVITKIRYKLNGRGFLPQDAAQIHVLDTESGEISQVTKDEYDCRQPQWSPDGNKIAYISAKFPEHELSAVKDIYVVPLLGGDSIRVTDSNAALSGISWSPKGDILAFYGHDNSRKGATVTGLCTVPIQGGPISFLTKERELAVAGSAGGDMGGSPTNPPAWSKDGDNLFFSALEAGRTHLYKYNLAAHELTQLTQGDCTVLGWSKSLDGDTFVIHVSSPTLIGDMFVLEPISSSGAGASLKWSKPVFEPTDNFGLKAEQSYTLKRLTNVNQSLLNSVHLSFPQEFVTKSKDGTILQGWTMKPVGAKEGEKYPALLQIHGGPHTAYGLTFFHEFQFLCSRGYGVVFCNPRGSTGYGQEFLEAIRHDWGGVDYEDVMAAADYAASLPWVDENAMGVLGGSYGGYMTNWVITQTNRFKAAVAQRSTCNRMSQFGASDAAFTNGQWEFDGDPWDNPKAYLDVSPLMYVRHVETPLMLIHSELDLRCPMEQAEEFFTALKKLGKTAILVRFPGENHDLSRTGGPRHRIERLEYMAAWFDKYLCPEVSRYQPPLSSSPEPVVVIPDIS